MKVCLIAAISENGVLGKGGAMPWRIPEDLRRFQRLTTGHAVIMGRRTYQAIGRPLANRRNIVLTRNAHFHPPRGVAVAGSRETALALAQQSGRDRAFVIGGGEIYRLTLPIADELYLTHIHRTVAGDTFFPEWDQDAWREISRDASRAHPDVVYAHYVRSTTS